MFPLDFRDSERLDAAEIARLPGAAKAGSALGYLLATRTPDGQIVDGRQRRRARERGRRRLLPGRRRRAPRRATAPPGPGGRGLRQRRGGARLRPPDRLDAAGCRRALRDLLALREDAGPEQFSALFQPIDLRVVGIGRNSDQLLANESQERGVVALSPAFARRVRRRTRRSGWWWPTSSRPTTRTGSKPRSAAATSTSRLQVLSRSAKEATFRPSRAAVRRRVASLRRGRGADGVARRRAGAGAARGRRCGGRGARSTHLVRPVANARPRRACVRW